MAAHHVPGSSELLLMLPQAMRVADLKQMEAAARSIGHDGFAALAAHPNGVSALSTALKIQRLRSSGAAALLATLAQTDPPYSAATLLEISLACASEALLRHAIASGADIEVRDGGGLRPLHRCCVDGNVRAVRALLEAGADIEALTPAGDRPLDCARDAEHGLIVDLLQTARQGATRTRAPLECVGGTDRRS